MKQYLYFRYGGKDKGKIFFRMPKNAKAFHRIAKSLIALHEPKNVAQQISLRLPIFTIFQK